MILKTVTLLVFAFSCLFRGCSPESKPNLPEGYVRLESRKISETSLLVAETDAVGQYCPVDDALNSILNACAAHVKDTNIKKGDILKVTPDSDDWWQYGPMSDWIRVTGVEHTVFEGVEYEFPKVFWIKYSHNFTPIDKAVVSSK